MLRQLGQGSTPGTATGGTEQRFSVSQPLGIITVTVQLNLPMRTPPQTIESSRA
jgi:hypothetical protein